MRQAVDLLEEELINMKRHQNEILQIAMERHMGKDGANELFNRDIAPNDIPRDNYIQQRLPELRSFKKGE